MTLFHPLPALAVQMLLGLLVLIGLDTVIGILSALGNGSFRLSKVADFLKTAILPIVGPNLVLAVLALAFGSTYVTVLESGIVVAAAALVGQIGAKTGLKLQNPLQPTNPQN